METKDVCREIGVEATIAVGRLLQAGERELAVELARRALWQARRVGAPPYRKQVQRMVRHLRSGC